MSGIYIEENCVLGIEADLVDETYMLGAILLVFGFYRKYILLKIILPLALL